jgi:hypothetical protein
MKKLTNIFIALATLISLAVITACNKEDKNNDIKPKANWTDVNDNSPKIKGCIYRTLIFDNLGNVVDYKDSKRICKECDKNLESLTLKTIDILCSKITYNWNDADGVYAIQLSNNIKVSQIPFSSSDKIFVKAQLANEKIETYKAGNNQSIYPLQEDIDLEGFKIPSGEFKGKSMRILKGNYILNQDNMNPNILNSEFQVELY